MKKNWNFKESNKLNQSDIICNLNYYYYFWCFVVMIVVTLFKFYINYKLTKKKKKKNIKKNVFSFSSFSVIIDPVSNNLSNLI